MKTTLTIGLSALVGSVLIAGAAAYVAGQSDDTAPTTLPAVPHTGEVTLLHAQRFTVDAPYEHVWRAERPGVTSGWLLVLEVPENVTIPRNMLEPVLYVGSQTAERLNPGTGSGRIVALVPGALELTESLIFYGDPALPEQIDAAQIRLQNARAEELGVRPPSGDTVGRVLADPITVANYDALHRRGEDLISKYSPQEQALVDSTRGVHVGN